MAIEDAPPLALDRPGQPFAAVARELLERRGWSQRDLARAVGVDPAHICRVLRERDPRPASGGLMADVARALDCDPTAFAEYREWLLVERIKQDPALRERLFRRLVTDG